MDKLIADNLFNFMLILSRIGGAFSMFPAVDNYNIPVRVRIAFITSLSFLLYPILSEQIPQNLVNSNIGLIFVEILTGIVIGIGAKFYFSSVYIIGQTISMQSGLGSATFFDPNQRSQTVLFTNLLTMVAITMIFVTDTHHLFINAIVESYDKFPACKLLEISDISEFVTHIINDSFIISFKISAPFLIPSLVMLFGAGILSRLMPNLQIFFIITPVQIILMFAILYLVIDIMMDEIIRLIHDVVTK